MDVGVWEAARCVRPYLKEFLGDAVAAEVDEELAHLLNSGDIGPEMEGRLREALEGHKATSVFLTAVLADAPEYRPPMVGPLRGSLPGALPPVRAEKLVCPLGDFVWYLPEVGVKPPKCPTPGHKLPLEPG